MSKFITKTHTSLQSVNNLTVPNKNLLKPKTLRNQTSIAQSNFLHPNNVQVLSRFLAKPIKETIEVKYSKRDTSNLFENKNVTQKSYMTGSHEESLDENQRPIKHGNSRIYTVGMDDLPLSKSARKIKYSYSRGRKGSHNKRLVYDGASKKRNASIKNNHFKKKRNTDISHEKVIAKPKKMVQKRPTQETERVTVPTSFRQNQMQSVPFQTTPLQSARPDFYNSKNAGLDQYDIINSNYIFKLLQKYQ